jgi:hypothetical protein
VAIAATATRAFPAMRQTIDLIRVGVTLRIPPLNRKPIQLSSR